MTSTAAIRLAQTEQSFSLTITLPRPAFRLPRRWLLSRREKPSPGPEQIREQSETLRQRERALLEYEPYRFQQRHLIK